MAFKKKEWKPRQGTGLNKFKIGNNGPVEIINVPDEVIQQGDGFTSDNMNGLEQRIFAGCEGNFYKYYNDISEMSDVISGYPGSKVTDIIIRGNTVISNNAFVSVGSNVNTNTVIPVKLYSQSEVLENTYNIQYAKINNDNGLLGIGAIYDEFEYSSKKLIKRCSQIILSGLTWTLESEASPYVLMYKTDLSVIANCDFIVNNGFTKINYNDPFDGSTQQIKIDKNLHITVLRSAITSAGSVNAVLSSLGAEIVIPIQQNVVILDEVPSIRINDTGKTKIGIDNALFDVILVDEESRTGLYVSEALGNAIDVGQIVEECNETRTETANALISITADKAYIDTKASEVTETATNGITQMNAILSEAQTTVGDIPDEISDIKSYIEYNEQNVKNNFTNAIKGSKNGAIVGIDDISPIEHTMKTKVRSKNLWQHTKGDTYTSQNRASYDSETKIYTVRSSGVNWYTHTLANPIPKNTAVSITVEVTSGVGSVSIGGYHKEDNNNSWQGSIDLPNNIDLSGKTYTASFTTTDTVTDFLIFVDAGTPITTPVVFRVQYEIGTTSTAYAPYISDLTAVKLSRYGKNLFNFNATHEGSNIKNFITTENSFSFKNINTKQSSYVGFNIYLQSGTYYINGTVSQNDDLKGGWALTDDTNTTLINDASRGVISKKFTITTTGVYKFYFYCNYNSPAETTVTYSNVQLEIGTTATEYEPYVTSVDYTPNADGTVEGVTSLYPNTTLITNTDGVIIDCEYNKDTNNVIEKLTQAIIALGGNV